MWGWRKAPRGQAPGRCKAASQSPLPEARHPRGALGRVPPPPRCQLFPRPGRGDPAADGWLYLSKPHRRGKARAACLWGSDLNSDTGPEPPARTAFSWHLPSMALAVVSLAVWFLQGPGGPLVCRDPWKAQEPPLHLPFLPVPGATRQGSLRLHLWSPRIPPPPPSPHRSPSGAPPPEAPTACPRPHSAHVSLTAGLEVPPRSQLAHGRHRPTLQLKRGPEVSHWERRARGCPCCHHPQPPTLAQSRLPCKGTAMAATHCTAP